MESICLDIPKKDGVSKLLAKIRESDYTVGPDPTHDLILREGQEVEINLRGNLKFQSLMPPIRFKFYSYLNTAQTGVYHRD